MLREREVFLHDARRRFRPGDLVRREAAQRNETAVVHNLLELPDGFEEPRNRLPVFYLLGDKPALAEGGERAFLTAPCLRRLGKEQVAEVGSACRGFIRLPGNLPNAWKALILS